MNIAQVFSPDRLQTTKEVMLKRLEEDDILTHEVMFMMDLFLKDDLKSVKCDVNGV